MEKIDRMSGCLTWLETQLADGHTWTVRFDVPMVVDTLKRLRDSAGVRSDERTEICNEMERLVLLLWIGMSTAWIGTNLSLNTATEAGEASLSVQLELSAQRNAELSRALVTLATYFDGGELRPVYQELDQYYLRCRF
jgi:hypothetical protein